MESQYFGHSHPLVFNENQNNQTNEANCSRCGEAVAGPSFSCVECGFFLHKRCAEAPSKIDHPFHHTHPLSLLPEPPYKGAFTCNFCKQSGETSVYHCSCNIDLHIKCALFSFNIAENKLGELQHIAIKDPSLISTEDSMSEELENLLCFGCQQPLLESSYFSLDCGFNLHIKCAELPHEINHPFHHKHPLVLQFTGEGFSCNICQQNPHHGFFYSCSPCKFALHVKRAELPFEIKPLCHRRHPLLLQFNSENLTCKACKETRNKDFVYGCSPCKLAFHTDCAFPPPVLKDKKHQHSFVLLLNHEVSFVCNACGTEGNAVAYICSTCMLMVHRKCISLPRVIKFKWDPFFYFHHYFLSQRYLKECALCNEEVNTEYGSYYCPILFTVVHVDCATKNKRWYDAIDPGQNNDEKPYDNLALLSDRSMGSISCVIEMNSAGETTKIRHFSHVHDLMLSRNFMENKIFCDGCMLFISTPFYYCSKCNFFLHKTCAELKKVSRSRFHTCRQPHILISDGIFKCTFCEYECSGFASKCCGCNRHRCVRCKFGNTLRVEAHPHPLLRYYEFRGQCNACGKDIDSAFRCKSCNFVLHNTCATLPRKVRRKCDEHLLALTYQDQSDYCESHYCDICEERRNPNYWFYQCATCDTSVHVKCALGKYSFIKRENIYKEPDHPHPLTFVEKAYYSSGCLKYGKPCRELALECEESGCSYIVHWECIKPSHLRQ